MACGMMCRLYLNRGINILAGRWPSTSWGWPLDCYSWIVTYGVLHLLQSVISVIYDRESFTHKETTSPNWRVSIYEP